MGRIAMKIGPGAAGVALAALAAACSGSEAAHAPARPSTSAVAAPRAKLPYPSPARWSVHPAPPSFGTAVLRLGGGGCLILERNGQRWTTRPAPTNRIVGMLDSAESDPPIDEADDYGGEPPWTPPSPCAGAGVAAVDRLPEEVTGIVRWPGTYGFVGVSGTVHVSRWPLGPIVRRIQPPEPLVMVKSTGGALLAIAVTGRVYRWEEESGYQRVDLGPVHAISVAAGPSGRAAILAAPEALFTTEDAGRHFQRVDTPSIGAQKLAVSDSGRIVALGVLSSLTWDPHEPASFAVTTELLEERLLDVAIEPRHRASATTLSQGRGVLDGDTCWEATVGDYGEWSLFRGKIDGSFVELPLADPPDRDRTANVLPAARGAHVALAVAQWEDRGSVVNLRVSHDGAATFGPKIALEPSGMLPVAMAVSPDGTVLLTGTCRAIEGAPPDDPDGYGEHACDGAPMLVRPDGTVVIPKSPFVDQLPASPAFSLDGRYAYFLGEDGGRGHASLYVSRDGGQSFEERPLETGDDDSRVSLSIAEDTTLTVSENGAVGAVFSADGALHGDVYAVTDADGRNLRIAEPPEGNPILAGFGDRVIARLRPSANDASAPVLAESLDGGKTWVDVPAPLSVRDGYVRRGDIRCSSAGCLIGDDTVRIGWGAGRDNVVPFELPETPAPPRNLRTTIVCEPRPGSTWTAIEGVQGGVFPNESDAARGSTAWMIPTLDPETGEVSAVSASIPDKPGAESRITKKRLLAPVPKKKSFALALRPQIEGVSLARAPIDVEGEDLHVVPPGRHVRDLEIAWENLEEGTTGHGRIDDAGTFGRSTALPTGQRHAQLLTAMLSVSPRGIFVRVDPSDPSAFFVDTKGKVRRFHYPAWPAAPLGGASFFAGDMVNVDGTFIATAEVRGGTDDPPELLLLMRPPPATAKPNEPWAPWSAMLAPGTDYEGSRRTRSDWTYDGGHLATWTLHTVPDSAYATAWMRRVLADGTLAPPRRLPTPYDLGSTPRGCTAQEHKDLPRLKFPIEWRGPGDLRSVRHAVLVHDPSEPIAAPEPTDLDPEGRSDGPTGPTTTVTSRPVYPPPATVPMGQRWMLTTGFVLRGDGATACLDAVVGRTIGDWNHAVMVSGDLSYGWYFRLAPALPVKPKKPPAGTDDPDAWPAQDQPSWPPRLEARPLACHYEPGATVPVGIQSFK